jgi:carboxypeptidase C (cathepsin A)
MKKNMLSILALCLMVVPAHLSAQEKKEEKKKVVYQYPAPSVTQHSLSLGGQKVNYTATAGHLALLNDKGESSAMFFYIAYTKDNLANPAERPVTFVFNGGPGSSSVWLHMGALGPKRVVMNDDGTAAGPPYLLADNDYSWLDKTDLVFIDPVQTGFSRPAEEVDKKDFTGYTEDIQSVGDFIHKYVSLNKRWASPKFLAGESYGTTRAAGLSGYLQDRHGMYLNGIVLISAVMNFQTLRESSGNDLPYVMFLPSFAATAYHHNKVDTVKFPDFMSFLEEVEAFAETEYNTALMKGDRLSREERAALAKRMSTYLGVSEEFIERNNLRINTMLFTKELLRKEEYTVGRFDSTIKGRDKTSGGTTFDFDPSYNLSIFGAYTMAINDHLSRNLKFENPDMVYEILTGKVQPWNYGPAQNQYLDNSVTLQSAIHKNPKLRVLVLNGYYDLATPYFATEYTIAHMFLAPEYRNNVVMKYYHGGHMMYTFPREIKAMTEDVRKFYEGNF